MEKIILYSTGCPKCTILKKKMDERNIQYEEENSVDKMLELGMTQLPMLSVDGNMMDFRDAIIWVNKK